MKFCCQIVATRGIKAQKVQCLQAFSTYEIIPTQDRETNQSFYTVYFLFLFSYIQYFLM